MCVSDKTIQHHFFPVVVELVRRFCRSFLCCVQVEGNQQVFPATLSSLTSRDDLRPLRSLQLFGLMWRLQLLLDRRRSVCVSDIVFIPVRSYIIWPLVPNCLKLRGPSLEDSTGPRGPSPPCTTTFSFWVMKSPYSWSRLKVGWCPFPVGLICSRGTTCLLLSGSAHPYLHRSRI